MSDSVKKTLIVSISVTIGVPLALLALFTYVDADNESRLEWVKAMGGFGTFAAAIAVVWGFRYTRSSVDNQTAQISLEHDSRLTEQFHRACSELGSTNEFSRISALYEVRDLVFTSPRFYERAVGVICSFIREPPYLDVEMYKQLKPRSDIRVCFEIFDELYRFDKASWAWYAGNLQGATIVDVYANGIPFNGWNLNDTTWLGGWIVNLSFANTEMIGSTFEDVNIRHVSFWHASLMLTTWRSVKLSYEYHKTPELPFNDGSKFLAPLGLQRAIDEICSDLSNGIRKEYEINVDGWVEDDLANLDGGT